MRRPVRINWLVEKSEREREVHDLRCETLKHRPNRSCAKTKRKKKKRRRRRRLGERQDREHLEAWFEPRVESER